MISLVCYVKIKLDSILDYLYPALANEIQQSINTHARINRFIVLYLISLDGGSSWKKLHC